MGFRVWGLGFGVWGLGFGVWKHPRASCVPWIDGSDRRVTGLGQESLNPKPGSGFRFQGSGFIEFIQGSGPEKVSGSFVF